MASIGFKVLKQATDATHSVANARLLAPGATWLHKARALLKQHDNLVTSIGRAIHLWGPKVGLVLSISALILLFTMFPKAHFSEILLKWVQDMGPYGYLVFIAIYAISTPLLFPGVFLTIFAGYVYGWFLGAMLSWVGSLLGALVSYHAGKTLLRSAVLGMVSNYPILQALNNVLDRGGGFWIVMLLRLSPVMPYSLLNYMLSTTKLKLSIYTYTTMIGLIPGTAMYTWLGTSAKNIRDIVSGNFSDDHQRSMHGWIFCGSMALSAILVVLSGVLSARLLKRELRRQKELNETYEVKPEPAATEVN